MQKIIITIIAFLLIVLSDIYYYKRLTKEYHMLSSIRDFLIIEEDSEEGKMLKERNRSIMSALGSNLVAIGLLLFWWKINDVAILFLFVSVICIIVSE